MLHWILPRLAAYIAVVVVVGLLFLAGASVCLDVAEARGAIRANGSLENIFEFFLISPERIPTDWLKMKNPDAPAVKREAEEEWGR
jgi:hypothetical protein